MNETQPVIDALQEATKSGIPVALATVIDTQGSMPRHGGSKMLIYDDGRTVGTVGGGMMEARVIELGLNAMQSGQPVLETFVLNSLNDGDPGICGGRAQVFIEPYQPVATLLVIGAGHCGIALAELGKWAGYRVVLCDDRADLCNETVVPGLDQYLVCPPDRITQEITIDQHTFVAAVTRGLPVDTAWMPPMLQTPAPYIGLIGSRRRWALTMQALHDQFSVSDENLSRIRAPIGLEIEAETPKEIAISILAEIIMMRRGGTGQPMKWMGKPEEA